MNDKVKLKILVCGVGFGQFYLKALERLKDEYELVGIFSRGSEISKRYAKKYKVPLLTDISGISKNDVDVACVVINSTLFGGKGSHIVEDFLKKGINVIQEQPVHIDDYINFLKLAQLHKCKYKLNTFYPDLRIVDNLIKIVKKLNDYSELRYITAECSVHVLFPLIDILGRALNGIKPWKFKKISDVKADSPFCIVSGYINDIPICINIQNQIVSKNPDNYMLLLHRIGFTTNCGNLLMTGTNGVIIWEPCIEKQTNEEGKFDLEVQNEFSKLNTFEIVNKQENITFYDMMLGDWVNGLVSSVLEFKDEIIKEKEVGNNEQYLIAVIQAWHDLAIEIGRPTIINEYYKSPLSLKELMKF
ncbi:hypothetical protein UT300002_27100 [Clostridium perfringens]